MRRARFAHPTDTCRLGPTIGSHNRHSTEGPAANHDLMRLNGARLRASESEIAAHEHESLSHDAVPTSYPRAIGGRAGMPASGSRSLTRRVSCATLLAHAPGTSKQRKPSADTTSDGADGPPSRAQRRRAAPRTGSEPINRFSCAVPAVPTDRLSRKVELSNAVLV